MVGEKISKIRKEKGLSLRDLSKLCGCTRSTVCRIELGHVDPQWSNVCKIADALGVSLDDLRKEAYYGTYLNR